ncbi:unnamed protein product [Rotaria sp. Silwood2]|nr:unnamed protein product [Rotaria sp. Silwood2]
MPIGICGILMAGGAYCPLNPDEYRDRLETLIVQIPGRLVLVQAFTRSKVTSSTIPMVDLSDIILDTFDIDFDRLDQVYINANTSSIIIGSSGSVGTPKIIVHTHSSFDSLEYSLENIDLLNKYDIALQIACCSYIIHVYEILNWLLFGATVVLLKPNNHMIVSCIISNIHRHQITSIITGPSTLRMLAAYLNDQLPRNVLASLRTLCTIGEAPQPKHLAKLAKYLHRQHRIICLYDTTECLIVTAFYVLNPQHLSDSEIIPLGSPLPTVKFIVVDDETQQPIKRVGQVGEIHIGGPMLFKTYLDDALDTGKFFLRYGNDLLMKTQDLATLDEHDQYVYIGRRDFQIRIRDQQIRADIIESVLMGSSVSIQNCVVATIDHNEQSFLVAYLASSSTYSMIDISQIKGYCQKHLTTNMIPNKFVILDQLPLNMNGKIDRKKLPIPEFDSNLFDIETTPMNLSILEDQIESIWCETIRHIDHCSSTTNFHSIGGDSLQFIQIFNRYQTEFSPSNTLNISLFLNQPTLSDHARLLTCQSNKTIQDRSIWSTLNLQEGIASFAQERIALDEYVRFGENTAIYNELIVFRVVINSFSLVRLGQAIQSVLEKHQVLRTSVFLNSNDGIFIQRVLDGHKTFHFSPIQTFENDDDLHSIIYQISINPNLFDVSNGCVFHCQVLRRNTMNKYSTNEELLNVDDVLVIVFHHIAYDLLSQQIFVDDLSIAYNTNGSLPIEKDAFNYIDYSVYEREIDMTPSREFWRLQLVEYNINKHFTIPIDRYRSSYDKRSILASVAELSFGDLSCSFLDYASVHQMTPFQLGLATFYAFIFKLTNGQNDLCISSVNANRYRDELYKLIGMFVATVPYRIQFKSDISFEQLAKQVKEQCLSILEHSHYPLQHILADSYQHYSNINFLEIAFDFITQSRNTNRLLFDTAKLESVSIPLKNTLAKFDFMFTFVLDPSIQSNTISFSLACSNDLFDQITVEKLVRRFEFLFVQLFTNKSIDQTNQMKTSIAKLSIILPEETEEIQRMWFHQLPNIIHTARASYAQELIWPDDRINIIFPYRVSSDGALSIQRLRQSLNLIVMKHESLRTMLFVNENGVLMQQINDPIDTCQQLFIVDESSFETEDELNNIIHDERCSPNHFDPSHGLQLFECIDDRPIYELSLILPEEMTLIQELNNTEVVFSPFNCVHHEFAYRASEHPQKVALVLDEQYVTYGETLFYVEQLQSYLGERRDQIICQCVECSIEMIIGQMAIISSGAAYCPLSPNDPSKRLINLVKQTRAQLVLVHSATIDKLDKDLDVHIVNLSSALLFNDELWQPNIGTHQLLSFNSLDDLAYLIFTSGSTGIPKLVSITHNNFMACMFSYRHAAILSGHDVVIQMAQCSFDVHIEECLGSLVLGSSLVLLHPEGQWDLEYLSITIQQCNITFFAVVPSIMSVLCDYLMEIRQLCRLDGIRAFDFGGEAIQTKVLSTIIKRLDPSNVLFFNVYGPAECAIASIYHRITKNEIEQGLIPIGIPFPNMQVRILDEFYQPVVPGMDGELFLAGVQRFLGYYDQEDLTRAALFGSFYRTGDLVRMDNKGLLHYIGRKDHQIKLHGQRIESGEIERCLLDASISACVVIKEDDDHLVAYVQKCNMNEEQLHEYCYQHLPSHMVPSRFILLEQMPLNKNGKLDRMRLPRVETVRVQRSIRLPSTLLEEQLQTIFVNAFHLSQDVIDVTKSFSQLGGTSIGVMRALFTIRKEVYEKMEISLLLSNSSIRQLATVLESLLVKNNNEKANESARETDSSPYPKPSLAIETLGILVLIYQWLIPIYIAYMFMWPVIFSILFISSSHLITYIAWQYLLVPSIAKGCRLQLFSLAYYHWWFLNRIWILNRNIWLRPLVGTPFYNTYLRACRARIGNSAHIYTTFIDAPWLVEIGDGTFVADEVYFNNISYQSRTFELHSISIGSSCSIGTRSVLYEGVQINDGSLIESYSAVKGLLISSVPHNLSKSSHLPLGVLFQLTCLVIMIVLHDFALKLAATVYLPMQPLFLSLTLCWLVWTVVAASIALLALKYSVGIVQIGTYALNSWPYLRCLWLRQLIVSSFAYSLSALLDDYQSFSLRILSWLGVDIQGTNIKLANVLPFLRFSSRLLSIGDNVTTFGEVQLVPFDVDSRGQCTVDFVSLSNGVTLGNECSVHPGASISADTLVGTLTRITRDTQCVDNNILLGIPACPMPFVLPLVETKPSHLRGKSIVFESVLQEIPAKMILLIVLSVIFWSTANNIFITSIIFPMVYSVLVCLLNRCYTQFQSTRYSSTNIVNDWLYALLDKLTSDCHSLLNPFVGGTQWVIYFTRGLEARIIGNDVILSDSMYGTEHHLITIEAHVRISEGAFLQVSHYIVFLGET